MTHTQVLGRFGMFEVDELARDNYGGTQQDVIFMAVGRSEELAPRHVFDAIQTALGDPVLSQFVVPCGYKPLRSAIAAHYSNSARTISSDQVFVGQGTSPFYYSVFQMLRQKGTAVLLPRPYYPLYLHSANLAGFEVRFYDIDPATFEIDWSMVDSAFAQGGIALAVTCSFGNPLGNAVKAGDLRRISQRCNQAGAYYWADEMYWNVDFDGSFVSAYDAGADLDGTIVTAGFSKGYRMYTRRVGYLVAPPSLCGEMQRHMEHAVLTVDPTIQVGALSAMQHPEDAKELSDLYRSRVHYCYDKLSKFEGLLTKRPSGGFNVFLDFRQHIPAHFESSGALARALLREVGIATTPGIDFGLEGFLRLTTTTPRFQEGIDRLSKYVATLYN